MTDEKFITILQAQQQYLLLCAMTKKQRSAVVTKEILVPIDTL
jgi:hypothetical protein